MIVGDDVVSKRNSGGYDDIAGKGLDGGLYVRIGSGLQICHVASRTLGSKYSQIFAQHPKTAVESELFPLVRLLDEG